ncbi:MAG: hypothetical protein JWL81_625 [Verrucomicrobiales bacterium]|nr:hypothetical protein [Verrucomicrobiales bacterium]
MTRFFSIPIFLLTLCCLLMPARTQAQEPELRVSPLLSARSIEPGQQAVLSYQITGAQEALQDFPQTIEVPGLSITYSGQSRRVLPFNGTPQIEITLRYTVQGATAGTYQIPAQTIKADNKEVQTAAVPVVITEPVEVDNEFVPSVQLSVGRTEFWKGEVVPVKVSILMHPGVQQLSQFFPQIKTQGFAVNRFDRSGGMEARQINGVVWRAFQLESVLTALQAGAQEFGPAEVKAELLIPFAGSVDDPFGRQQGNRRNLTLTSNTLKVNVKELPLEGRPADFGGAVGDFNLELEASPLTLNAGDPIALEIAVGGIGNFDAIAAPKMESTDGWRLYAPRVSQENRAWGTEQGRKSFTQILIPEKMQTEIPPFVMHFFNPETGAYVTRRSQPIALTVTGEFKPAAAGPGDARDFAGVQETPPPSEELGDILDQPLTDGKWLATAVAPVPVNRIFLHAAPAFLLLLVIGQGIRRRLIAAAAARRPVEGTPREPHAILTDLRRPGTSRHAFHALVNEYLGSVEFHQSRTLTDSPETARLIADRDRYLYGPADDASRAAIPVDEQRANLETLSRLQPKSSP